MERELRTYERVAYKEHFCYRCCDYIHPGEMYEGRVVITKSRKLFVWKTHKHPLCDFPEDPDKGRKDLDNIVSLSEELRMAA